MNEEPIGTIAHYWPKAHAAEIALEGTDIRVGDEIRIVGHGHDFIQQVKSIQVEHAPRLIGRATEPVGIAVEHPVHENDEVFLVRAADSS